MLRIVLCYYQFNVVKKNETILVAPSGGWQKNR